MSKIQLPTRIADYLCVIGLPPPATDEPKLQRLTSSGGRRQSVTAQAKPAVLQRFPEIDHNDAEFPKEIPIFCFPRGVVTSAATQSPSSTFSFVLTEANGARVFCGALLFWEQREQSDDSDVTTHESEVEFMPKCLVITSHWPFFMQFDIFLRRLQRQLSEPCQVPLERVISNFIFEVPLPPLGKLEVDVDVLGQRQVFKRPPPNQQPMSDLNFSVLFRLLSVDNIIQLFAAVLSERRVLFVSSKLEHLTVCAETITYLIFPFFWQHIYIPILPRPLIDYVCAPMPFVMGVEASYLPDELLLDGVVLVDLQANEIRTYGSETLSPLPDSIFSKLQKDLKKLVDDTKVPIKSDQTVQDVKLKKYFLAFFIRLFKNYHKFLEAPDEAITEKFQKENFIADIGLKNDDFMQQFTNAQLFQCFVDERFEQSSSAKSENLNVLFFDECIDEEDGKPTPFLSDTSQQHQQRFTALEPNMNGLDRGSKWNYRGVFPVLQKELYGPVREVTPLVTKSADNQVQAKANMSKLSMKFFNDKRMYAHHFHALRLRSNKQDLAFKDISTLFRNTQLHLNKSSPALSELTRVALQKDTLETGTTLDQAWLNWKKYMDIWQNDLATEQQTFDQSMAFAVISAHNSTEHELKMLFEEASVIEAQASQGKQVIEKAKSRQQTAKKRYNELKESSKSKAMSSFEISRLVAAQNEEEQARLARTEAETSFRSILDSYEFRMPQISAEVRKLNATRIGELKKALNTYIQTKEEILQSQLNSLAQLRAAANSIDLDKDLASFSEGSKGFVDPTAPPAAPPSLSASAPNASPALGPSAPTSEPLESITHKVSFSQEPTQAAVEEKAAEDPLFPSPDWSSVLEQQRANKCFSVHLWGERGFELVVNTSEKNRKSLKEFVLCLENLADIISTRAKSSDNALQRLPELAVPGSTLKRAFKNMCEVFRFQSQWSTQLAEKCRALASALRVTKGELKACIKMLGVQKVKLQKEVETAAEACLEARARRDQLQLRLNAQFAKQRGNSTVKVAAGATAAEAMRGEQAELELKEGDHQLTQAERTLIATQNKCDVCIAQSLDLFETKERARSTEIKSACDDIATLFRDLLTCDSELSKQLHLATESLDSDTDLRDFIVSVNESAVTLTVDEKPSLSKHLAPQAYDRSLTLFSRSMQSIESMLDFLDAQAELTEVATKQLKKNNWENVNANASTATLQSVLIEFKKTCEGLSAIFEHSADKTRESVMNPLLLIKTQLKSHVATAQHDYTAGQKRLQASNQNVQDARENESSAQEALKASEAKLSQAESGGEVKGFMSIFSSSVESLKEKVATARHTVAERIKDRERLEADLKQTEAANQTLLNNILTMFHKDQRDVFGAWHQAFEALVAAQRASDSELTILINAFGANIIAVDTPGDIQTFINANLTNTNVPDTVKEARERAIVQSVESMKEDWAENAKSRRKRPSVFRRTSLRVDLSLGAPTALVDTSPAVSIASSFMVAPSPSSSSIGVRSASHDEFAGFDDPIEAEEPVVLPSASVQPEATPIVMSHHENSNTVEPARSESIEHPHQPVVNEIQHEVAVDVVVVEEVVAPVAPVESIQGVVDVPVAALQPVPEPVVEQIAQPQHEAVLPSAPVETVPMVESVDESHKVAEMARSSSVSVSTPPQTPPTATVVDSPIVPVQSLAPASPPTEAAPSLPLSPPPVPPPPPPPSSQPKRTSIINPAFPLIPPVSPSAAAVSESVAPSSPAPAAAPPPPPKVPALPKRALPKLPPT